MTKAAVKKRNQRKNWSDDKKKAVNAKKAENQKANYAKQMTKRHIRRRPTN